MDQSHLKDTEDYPTVTEPPPVPKGAPPRVTVETAAQTHCGHVRAKNEDHYLVGRVERRFGTLLTNLADDQLPTRTSQIGYGMLVADGMGGHSAGEVASGNAIRLFLDLILDTPDWIMSLRGEEGIEVSERMVDRFREIDATLSEWSRREPKFAGMGTTLTLACSVGTDLIVTHVGDSRAYLYRQGQLHRLTHDQTVAQEMADAGTIRPADVATHRFRHVLTQALGRKSGQVCVEAARIKLYDGDEILLCSDGLTEMVDDSMIAAVLTANPLIDDACQTLVQCALDNGGKDNVTVALARYHIAGGTR
jgi:PPM family protein phosphatase